VDAAARLLAPSLAVNIFILIYAPLLPCRYRCRAFYHIWRLISLPQALRPILYYHHTSLLLRRKRTYYFAPLFLSDIIIFLHLCHMKALPLHDARLTLAARSRLSISGFVSAAVIAFRLFTILLAAANFHHVNIICFEIFAAVRHDQCYTTLPLVVIPREG